jgi:hypothetical protein
MMVFTLSSPDELGTRLPALSIDQENRGGRGSASGAKVRTSGDREAAAAIGDGASGSASCAAIESMPEQTIMQSVMHPALFAGSCSAGDWS